MNIEPRLTKNVLAVKYVLVALISLISVNATSGAAEAKSCADLRALCWTMRTDKSDCTGPYLRCIRTGVFVTPLGRVFKATSR